MSAIPLVQTNELLQFVRFLAHIGSPTERLLKQARLPVFVLDEPEALIPLYQGFAFAEQAARKGIEDVGSLVSQQTQVAQRGAFVNLICQSLTLYDLLNTIIKLNGAYNSGEQVWLSEEGDRMWLHHQYPCPHHIKNRQAQDYATLLYLKAIQLAMEPEWQPEELHFQFSRCKGFAEIELCSHTPIYFNQPHNAIRFSKSLLSMPLKHLVEAAPSHSPKVEETLQSMAPASDFAGSLRRLLQSLLHDGYPDVTLVASVAGMSVRSFQRRLTETNLNYSLLIEQVRFDEAVRLLQEPTLKIIDIAFELCYTDAANFSRAFKRWTGVSPREFRCLHIKDYASGVL